MSEKPKFFFEADTTAEDSGLNQKEHADTFFNTLKTAGVIQDSPEDSLEAKQAQADASMKKLESKVLLIEYGTYQTHYAIHITPTHPVKNLSSEPMVKKALMEFVVILNEYVPYNLQVDLFLPREDWKMKVISAKVVDGTSAWNFNVALLESVGIPRIFNTIEKIILGV